jgi:phage shock protein E
MMKKILTLLIMLCSFSALADPVYWIDVRTAAEFNTGHLAGAVNIPHGEIANEIGGLTQDKNAEIYLYCRSGGRAGKALNALEKLGYTQVVNEGGYDDVVEKMKKVEAKPNSIGY